jgi:hypothetical protein
MRRIICLFFTLTLSLASFADCTNAFRIKANRRAKVNRVIKQTTIVVGGVAVATGSVALLISTGGGAVLVSAPAFAALELAIAGGLAAEVDETKLNNYFKGLAIIEASKQGMIPKILHGELDKKMSFFSYSGEEQKQMNEMILKFVSKANKDKVFCKNKEGQIKPITFNKMINLIADELVQNI